MWEPSRSGIAPMVHFQVFLASYICLRTRWKWIFSDFTEGNLCVKVGFAGRTRAGSVPVVVLASSMKKTRRRAAKVHNQLDWIGNSTPIQMLTFSLSAAGMDERWTKMVQASKRPGSYTNKIKTEAEKRLKKRHVATNNLNSR
jgi:hypothetical protein